MLSSTPVAESFVDAATHEAIVPESGSEKPLVSVRRADWVRNTIETLLWDMPVFLTEHPSPVLSEEQEQSLYRLDRRRIVIVGGGTIGYEFLKAVGKNPWGMAMSFEKLKKVSEGSGAQSGSVQKLFSSHPDTDTRIKRMSERATAEGYKRPAK